MSPGRVAFRVHLLVSLLVYAGILLVNILLVNFLFHQDHVKAWFLPCLGLLLLPSVVLQLVSAVLLLIDQGDRLTMTSSVGLGVLHILQLGFVSRHVALFWEVDPKTKTRDALHLSYLQILCTFTSFLPLLFIHTFIILYYGEYRGVMLVAAVTTLFGSCYYLASFRRQKLETENELITCSLSETMCKLSWRFGELVSRILALVVFTTVYRYWIFLILGLRGLTMLVCLCTSVLTVPPGTGQTKMHRSITGIVVAYIFSFAFINFQPHSYSVFRYAFFYTITFLENIVLLMVWYFHSDQYTGEIDKNSIIIAFSGAFIVGILSLIIYHKCCYKIALFDSEAEHIYYSEECINCRLSVCSKHSIKHQRPFSAGWQSQYQKAVTNGNYYKNILQDTYLDSDVNSTVDIFNSSGEHCQIRDTDLESIRTNQNKQTIAVQATGTYTHKRFFDSTSSVAQFTDTDSISSGSGVYEEDWRQKSSDTILSQLSALDALSLVSSRTQLLTDSWDSLLKENKRKQSDTKHPKKIDILNSLIKKDLDTSFFSDGYTTDHTLESYQLPVTVLAKKRPEQYNRDRLESAYSTASDSTDCTICAFIRQNPSSPEETRKKSNVKQTIQEEVYVDSKRRKRREYAGCNNAASRSRRHNLSTDQSGSERSYTHKYEKALSRNRRSKRDAIIASSTSSTKNKRSNNYHPRDRNVSVKSDLCPVPVHYSSNNITSKQVPLQTKLSHQPIIKSANQFSDIDMCQGNRHSDKSVRETASDSGDSAFPRYTPVSHTKDSAVSRHTPLSAYLAVTNEDNDGTSESSCEMII